MDKKVINKKINEMLKADNIFLKKRIEKILKSGAINISEYNNDDYILPKILLYNCYIELSFQRKPLLNEHKKTAENLINF